MDSVELHEGLDRDGLLDVSRGPGCYSLECSKPDDLEARWADVYDVPVQTFARSALDAPRVVYVGASGDVYDRLEDHATGDKRRSGFLRVFPPERVIDVWPMDDPFSHEGRIAYKAKADLPDAYVYSDAIR